MKEYWIVKGACVGRKLSTLSGAVKEARKMGLGPESIFEVHRPTGSAVAKVLADQYIKRRFNGQDDSETREIE